MRRIRLLLLILMSTLLSCSAISSINELPNVKQLTKGDIGSSGGKVEFLDAGHVCNGVSITVDKNTVVEETEFKIKYYESFPKKPKNMNPESMAYIFSFESEINKRVKITIPYITDSVVLTPIALFSFDKKEGLWHFAGCTSINENAKTISTLIDGPGVYAAMSYAGDYPSHVFTDFEIGWDTFTIPSDSTIFASTFTEDYNHALTSYAFWYYNNKRDESLNLNDKYDVSDSCTKEEERLPLLVTLAASGEFYKSQFTSVSEFIANTKLSGENAAYLMKTALIFENRPIIAALQYNNEEHTVIINKYYNNDFSCYAPHESNNELTLSFDRPDLVLKDKSSVIATVSKISFLGPLSSCDEGYEKVYDYFENSTTNIACVSVAHSNNSPIYFDTSFVNGCQIDITNGAVLNDRKVIIDELTIIPDAPKDATWAQPLFRVMAPIDSMFDQPIEIRIPYVDSDSDGIDDNIGYPLHKLYVAAYNFDTRCWAPVEINFDLNDNLLIKSQYASDYAMFYFEPNPDTPESGNCSITVKDSWPVNTYDPKKPKLTEAQVIEDCLRYNMATLNVSAFECTDLRRFKSKFQKDASTSIPYGLSWGDNWYNLEKLISEAKLRDFNVNLIISCFNYTTAPIDDVDSQDTQAAYIVNDLIPYLLDNYKGFDGIILKDISYENFNSYPYSSGEIKKLTRFIQRVRETIGKKASINPELILEIEPSLASDFGNEYGQKFSEFSKYADRLILKHIKKPYVYNRFYNGSHTINDISKHIEHAKLLCSEQNNTSLTVNISTDQTGTSIAFEDQIKAAHFLNIDGFTIDDYTRANDYNYWSIIMKYAHIDQ